MGLRNPAKFENHTAQPQFRIEMLTTNTTARHCVPPRQYHHQNDRGVQKFRDLRSEARSSCQFCRRTVHDPLDHRDIGIPAGPRKSLHDLVSLSIKHPDFGTPAAAVRDNSDRCSRDRT